MNPWISLCAGAGMLGACSSGQAPLPEIEPATVEVSSVSPVRKIRRDQAPRPAPAGGPARGEDAFRSLDGTDNNLDQRDMGAAGIALKRRMPAAYADGYQALAGPDRAPARMISNAVFAQERSIPNPQGLSGYLWQWGQFVDHDIDLSEGTDPAEPAPLAIPTGDPWFDPAGSGGVQLAFNRSIYAADSGTAVGNPRQQRNEITAWIDASQVYGSDAARARALRTLDGSGRLRTSRGDLLPFNTTGLANAGGPSSALFLAGDVRANEQVGLTAMHTLFVREHNRHARELAARQPDWDGEQIYQQARRLVGAEMQVITYQEFLPALLGPDALPPYAGYKPDVDASIMNEFSTAAYRLGHSMLNPEIWRLDSRGREIHAGHLELRDAFFSPSRLIDEGGIEPLLRGLAAQPSERVDLFVVDDVRNFLFGFPGEGGFDLVALNIQRGRDHGLPSYNVARAQMGLAPLRRFAQISADPEVQQRLAAVYASPDDIDLWVGGLAEDATGGGQVGPLFQRILIEQFRQLRDGDRYWYTRVLSPEEIREVEQLRLADIIRRNTEIGAELADDVFRVAQTTNR